MDRISESLRKTTGRVAPYGRATCTAARRSDQNELAPVCHSELAVTPSLDLFFSCFAWAQAVVIPYRKLATLTSAEPRPRASTFHL